MFLFKICQIFARCVMYEAVLRGEFPPSLFLSTFLPQLSRQGIREVVVLACKPMAFPQLVLFLQ